MEEDVRGNGRCRARGATQCHLRRARAHRACATQAALFYQSVLLSGVKGGKVGIKSGRDQDTSYLMAQRWEMLRAEMCKAEHRPDTDTHCREAKGSHYAHTTNFPAFCAAANTDGLEGGQGGSLTPPDACSKTCPPTAVVMGVLIGRGSAEGLLSAGVADHPLPQRTTGGFVVHAEQVKNWGQPLHSLTLGGLAPIEMFFPALKRFQLSDKYVPGKAFERGRWTGTAWDVTPLPRDLPIFYQPRGWSAEVRFPGAPRCAVWLRGSRCAARLFRRRRRRSTRRSRACGSSSACSRCVLRAAAGGAAAGRAHRALRFSGDAYGCPALTRCDPSAQRKREADVVADSMKPEMRALLPRWVGAAGARARQLCRGIAARFSKGQGRGTKPVGEFKTMTERKW